MSVAASGPERPEGPERARWLLRWAVLLLATAGCSHAPREPGPLLPGGPKPPPAAAPKLLADAEASFARRPDVDAVRRADLLFRQSARADESDVAGLYGSIRAKVWLIEHDQDSKRRSSMAAEAVEAGRLCERRVPGDPRCEYGLALALGLEARETRSLKPVTEMLEHLRRASARDPRIDHAGPERLRAIVLLKAPGWPLGPGDSEAALKVARRAAALFPDHAPNQIVLAEALDANGSRREARATAARALQLAEGSVAAGDPDAPDWVREARKLAPSPRS